MGMGVRTQGAAGGLWEAPGAELWLPVPPPPPASPLPSFPPPYLTLVSLLRPLRMGGQWRRSHRSKILRGRHLLSQ